MKTPLKAALAKLDDVPAQTRIEVIKGVTVRRKKNGLTVMAVHYSAIPDRDPETEKGAKWFEREYRKYSSRAQWRKEQEIDPDATGGEAVFGKILGEFYEVVIISDPHWFPDPRWDVVCGFDHGVANATCMLKAYVPRESIDPKTGRKNPSELYVCGEFYSYRREGWDNNVDQNCIEMRQMPDVDRARWIVADPSLFYDSQAQDEGKPKAIYSTYRKNNFFKMRPYDGVRSDVTFVEWLMSDYWRGIANGRPPRLHIVCRNPSDRPQPGLHPYDCPNLLWEMRRAKRVELTATQLLTKNPSEDLQKKNNHALDALKYMTGTFRTGTEVPVEEAINEELSKLDAFTGNLRARFLMSELALQGKLGPDGRPKKGKAAIVVDLRRGRGVISTRK